MKEWYYMKKFISVLLVFAALTAMLSVCGFAADADFAGSVQDAVAEAAATVNNYVGDFFVTVSDHISAFNETATEAFGDINLNGFLAQIDAFIESICAAVIEAIAKIELPAIQF